MRLNQGVGMGEWLPLSVKQQAELRERVGSSEEGKKTWLKERVGVEWRRVGGTGQHVKAGSVLSESHVLEPGV